MCWPVCQDRLTLYLFESAMKSYERNIAYRSPTKFEQYCHCGHLRYFHPCVRILLLSSNYIFASRYTVALYTFLYRYSNTNAFPVRTLHKFSLHFETPTAPETFSPTPQIQWSKKGFSVSTPLPKCSQRGKEITISIGDDEVITWPLFCFLYFFFSFLD